MPDEIVDVITQPLAHLLAHRGIAREAAGDLPAVAPAGAPADLVGLDDGDLVAALGKFHRGGHTGEAAADDGDVDVHLALQGGVVGFLVEGRGVVGGRAFGGGFRVLQCGVHLFLSFLNPWVEALALTPALSRRERGLYSAAGCNRSADAVPSPPGRGLG
ncbi:hypothetical protein D3C81_1507700 [compost metagenome]